VASDQLLSVVHRVAWSPRQSDLQSAIASPGSWLRCKLGFGMKQGAEALAHAARCYINNLSPGEAFLKIDFTNAFNAISRDEVFSSSE